MGDIPPFVELETRAAGYNMMPVDYNTMVGNLRNLNARVAVLEGLEIGGLTEPTNVPVGGIIVWPKSQGEIPSGWAVCDGNNGTPDLRGLFVFGASVDDDVNDSGGSETHSHQNPRTGTASGHSHAGSGAVGVPSGTVTVAASSYAVASGGHTHNYSFTTGSAGEHSHGVGDTDTQSNLPPFIKLFYIMRIS
jgi:hypothetical protein